MDSKINKKTMNRLVEIAKKNCREILERGDLETRLSDGEDFKEIAVWDLKQILIDAYLLGQKEAISKHKNLFS